MSFAQGSWALERGATCSGQGVWFKVWAPRASSVSVRVRGTREDLPMDREGSGFFSTHVQGVGPGTRYFYVLNSHLPRPDPVSRFQPEGVHGPSEVIDPDTFQWDDQAWKGISLEEMILYEIHTGTFTAAGTFESLLPHLDYLRGELGVTAVELMPVAQFPGERNWGYDGVYLFAPQNSYGGPAGLKTLVNACHQRGLAVILDVVYNHLGPEGNYLGDYGPYFTDRYRTPWGSAINYDGPESDEVRRLIVGNALFWVTEYHVDGLRLDAVHGIFDFSARHILAEIRDAVHRQGEVLGRHVHVIAESDLNDVRVIDPPSRGGYGLDAQWNDDFHHGLHTLLTKERNGYYQDFGRIDQLAKAFKEGFVYSGQYSAYRKRRHGNSARHVPPKKFVVFSQNHDQVGNRARGERLTALLSEDALKLAAGVVLLSPHIPLLFMGEEYGEEAPFLYFVSHSDPGLIEAVRKGREREFVHFQCHGGIPDPQEEATFLRSKIDFSLRAQGKHRSLLNLYRGLIRLRKEHPSLGPSDRGAVRVQIFRSKKAILVRRGKKGEDFLCLFNFSDQTIEVNVRVGKGTWKKIVDSSLGGDNEKETPASEWIESDGSETGLPLSPYSFVVYGQAEESDLKSRPDPS